MKYAPALKALVLRFAAGWLPPVRIALSQWADDHARLSSEASAQVGGWHSFPYQREPLETRSTYEWKTAAQSLGKNGFTERP